LAVRGSGSGLMAPTAGAAVGGAGTTRPGALGDGAAGGEATDAGAGAAFVADLLPSTAGPMIDT
jgi:hypothetical protein